MYNIKPFGLISIPEDLGAESMSGRAREIDPLELKIVKDVCLEFIDRPINIMEIGVHRNKEESFTEVFIKNKHPDSKYFGVDINDKSYLNAHNVYTFQNSSFEYDKVVAELNRVGIFSLDILLIDGDHHVGGAFTDWSYSALVNKGGKILIHAVHTHDGPRKLMKLIDPELFDIEFLTDKDSGVYGLGMATRK